MPARVDADHPDAVAANRGDRAGDVRAMGVLIRVPLAGRRQVDAADELVADMVFVARVDTGVDDAQGTVAGGGIAELVGLDRRDAVGHDFRVGHGRRRGQDLGIAGRLRAHRVALGVDFDDLDALVRLQGLDRPRGHTHRQRVDAADLAQHLAAGLGHRGAHARGRARLVDHDHVLRGRRGRQRRAHQQRRRRQRTGAGHRLELALIHPITPGCRPSWGGQPRWGTEDYRAAFGDASMRASSHPPLV
jgi:hypothetical protein